MIEAKEIYKTYKDREVIKNLSFTIQKNKLTSITGESGSGKTTLLNVLSLLEKPDKGTIKIEGIINPKRREVMLLQRNVISYLFQNYGLIEDETVEENLKISFAYKKIKDIKLEMHTALLYVGMPGFEKRKVYELSGGEQQRVALARVILKDSDYIFADEPTGNLDTKNRDLVFSILRDMANKGKGVVLVTHDAELARQTDYNITLERDKK